MAINIKEELKAQVNQNGTASSGPIPAETKTLPKNISIPDAITAIGPEIQKALPKFLTPERFLRIAMSATNTTPKLKECITMSVICALLTAAQLGLEPNTPLGQAYLIPYFNNKDKKMYCQFQIGYRGLIDLAYRSGQVEMIQAHPVFEKDYFEYQFGLEPKCVHRPAAVTERGKAIYYYGIFRLLNGGFGYCVMSKEEMDEYAGKYSKVFRSGDGPWQTNYDEMALKTVIKRALKYAPVNAELQHHLSADETVKSSISDDMMLEANEFCWEEIPDGDG